MKPQESFRNYDAALQPGVRDFYAENHAKQTLDFVLAKKNEYLPLQRRRMSVWTAIEALESIIDASDPDLDLPQLVHALQTSEALRRDGKPAWMILTGFLHDLGKVLCLFDEPQWAVVGDTFPVGCAFSPRIVHADLFAVNPDTRHPERASRFGIYRAGCGLDSVHLSWGHDEYLYHVLRAHLPDEALAIIRWHSFYAWHREGEYDWMTNATDRHLLQVVQEFNPYDLYSKSQQIPDWPSLRAYYEDLAAAWLPPQLQW